MRWKKALIILIYVVFISILLETWARGYYAARKDVSFFASPGDLLYVWYPELKNLENYGRGEKDVNILLLGGSALTEDWGNVPEYLADEWEISFGQRPKIVNLASPAHSSLDSLYKYRCAGEERFDLVVFYHGINEVRANNVPPEKWKKDYSHYSWYDEVNFYFRYPWLRKTGMMFPYFAKHLQVQFDREVIKRGRFVPTHSPKMEEWLEYGREIKTRESFRENILEVVRVSETRDEPVMVMTYAHYTPGEDAYNDPEDHCTKFMNVWGDPRNVMLGMMTHNEVIRELAPGERFIFLDQEQAIGHDEKYFSDICHFSNEGSKIFAENIIRKIRDITSKEGEGDNS